MADQPDIIGSLGGLPTAMERLAKGDLVTVVPGTGRDNEVGGVAMTVLIFKEHMETAQRLTAEQAQEHARAEAAKHEALGNMADRIEIETGTSLQGVAARTSAMTATAQEMSASAVRKGNAAQSVRTASAQALANAQTAAAEQLSRSVNGISG